MHVDYELYIYIFKQTDRQTDRLLMIGEKGNLYLFTLFMPSVMFLIRFVAIKIAVFDNPTT